MDDVFEGHQNGKPKRHDGKDPWRVVRRDALDDASRAVVTRLDEVGEVAVGDAIAVVIERERDDTQGRFEEVWLEVTGVEGATIAATFDSQPTYVRGVSAGDALSVSPAQILTVRRSRRR